jgi:hypothetical protein
MCFNKEVSIGSLALGLTTSFMLIKFGNPKYESSNKTIGYFFMFVSLMQLVDYMIWVDINCTTGLNRLAGYIGPILNNFQPTILYLLSRKYLDNNSNSLINSKYLLVANIVYAMYTTAMYASYVDKNKLCSGTQNTGHLLWAWRKDFNYLFYQLMMLLNILMFLNDKMMMTSILISYILFFVSYKFYSTNIGELWCYFVIYIPMLILTGQKIYS